MSSKKLEAVENHDTNKESEYSSVAHEEEHQEDQMENNVSQANIHYQCKH